MKAKNYFFSLFTALIICSLTSFGQDNGFEFEDGGNEPKPDIEHLVGLQMDIPDDFLATLAPNSILDSGSIGIDDNEEEETGIDTPIILDDEEEEGEIEKEEIVVRGDNGLDINEIHLFPNPAQDYINLRLEYDGVYTIEIYNLIGNALYKETFDYSGIDRNINLADLSTGIYLMSIQGENVAEIKKFAIKRN